MGANIFWQLPSVSLRKNRVSLHVFMLSALRQFLLLLFDLFDLILYVQSTFFQLNRDGTVSSWLEPVLWPSQGFLGTGLFISGEQGNKGQILRGTWEKRQYWGTGT